MRRLDRCIGRDLELGVLRSELDAALLGEGRVVVLEGEAGIGKSFLLECLVEAALEAKCAVWRGRAREQVGCPPWWPWLEALESGSATGPAAQRAALLMRAGLDRTEAEGGAADPARARFELHHAVVPCLSPAPESPALVVVLDDMHLADRASLELLAFVGPEIASQRVLIAVARRPDGCLERLGGRARSLPIGGLAAAATGELLERDLGRAPSAAIVEQVEQLTSGNPFFVGEVARLLRAVPDAGAGGTLPAICRDIPARRLAALPQETRALLDYAATFGVEFRLPLLAPAAGLEAPDVRARLGVALACDIVVAAPGGLDRFAFAHALLRDAHYDAIPAERRARLHGAVARAIEEHDRDADPDTLALHYYEASRSSDPTPALRYACAAGERALDSLGYEAALGHFERALELLERSEQAAPEQRVRAWMGCGVACRWSGRPERAKHAFVEGIRHARALAPEIFASSVLRMALQTTEFQLLDVATNDLLREALAALPEAPSPLRAQLLARLATGLHLDPDAADERLAMSREAIAMARASGDARALASVRSQALANLLSPDHRDERARTIAEVLDDPGAPVASRLEARLAQLGHLAQEGDRVRMDLSLRLYEREAREAGLPYHLWQHATHGGMLALLEGRFEHAESAAAEAFVQGQRIAPQSAAARFAGQLIWMRGWQGRLSEVVTQLERNVERTEVVPAWRSALASLYVYVGREHDARREFEALAASDFEVLPRDSTWLSGMATLTSVCCQLGDVARAERLEQMLEPFAGQVAVAVPMVVLMAPVDVRLGALAHLLGKHERAVERCEAALRLAERMSAAPWQAEARYHLARALVARGGSGDAERAREQLGRADALARTVGMHALTAWIAAERAAWTPERVSPAPVAAPSAADVFRREGEVWSLEFRGRATRLRDMRGLGHLARLLAEPGRELHVVDLAGVPGTAAVVGDAGEHLDLQARADYARRLRDAREDLAEAERANDRGRIELRREEIEWLAGELRRGVGLGGRTRRARSASERARQSVTRAIKYAIDKIERQDAELADHLRRNVRTGTFCSYAPPASDRASWRL